MAGAGARLIVLDTNVISEIMKPRPDPLVTAWYLRQDSASLWTTAISLAESLFGIGILPDGRRRRTLSELANITFNQVLGGRILPFDDLAAAHFAQLRSQAQRRGRPMDVLDAQIAAIAVSAGASIATRNTSHFAGCGARLIDPWGDSPG